MGKIIVLFQKDFRLYDNAAFIAAAKRGAVIPLFIFSEEDGIELGSAAACYLHDALSAFEQKLKVHNLQLTVRRGNKSKVLQEFMRETAAKAIYMNYRTINEKIENPTMSIYYFSDMLLHSSEGIFNKMGEPYKIYSAFYKRFLYEDVARPLLPPTNILSSPETYPSLSIDELALLPKFKWGNAIRVHWEAGEEKAMQRWACFLGEGVHVYKEERDVPAKQATSALSAHIAFGEISVRVMWHMLKERQEMTNESEQIASFLTYEKQLVWREFAYYELLHYPTMPNVALRSQFEAFLWQEDEVALTSWQKGQTGYPIVDAGMRQLWQTGWMHNRVRMIVASFLVKHLLIRWQEGEKWFASTLIDFDIANNALGWQWCAGCGIDASPYFRIFNPILQGQKFDATGEYVKRWVPELAGLPSSYIHAPWKAPKHVLQEAQITLGDTYPFPIIDHAFARERALAAYAQVKNRT